jgi:hypothetical protein
MTELVHHSPTRAHARSPNTRGAPMSLESNILFKNVDYTLDNLLSYIDIGDIGLPDIQRPFVWNATKVRDLFNSMNSAFPAVDRTTFEDDLP